MAALAFDEILDLVVGRESAGLAAREFEGTADGDVELAGFAGFQFDFNRAAVGGTQFFEAFPHTEGLRLVASTAAIFDQDLHLRSLCRLKIH